MANKLGYKSLVIVVLNSEVWVSEMAEELVNLIMVKYSLFHNIHLVVNLIEGSKYMRILCQVK